MAKGTNQKRVPAGRGNQAPPRKAVPNRAANPGPFTQVDQSLFRVRWSRFDFHGTWCIGLSPSSDIVTLMTRIRDMEKMPPLQVWKGDPGKDYGDPSRLPSKAARDRLEELNLMDETSVSRLRISGAQRLYGFRRDPEFYAVFWDPKHEIWP